VNEIVGKMMADADESDISTVSSEVDDNENMDNDVDVNVDVDVEEIKVGDKIPSMTLQEGLPNSEGKKDVDISELIAGKKVIIFGVPGAFTPGCSKSHLPSFITAKEELKRKGIEIIICIATNDLYVMSAWGQQSGGTDAGIIFLSDSNADLTMALGLGLQTPMMMTRTKRFSLIAENGIITHYFSSTK